MKYKPLRKNKRPQYMRTMKKFRRVLDGKRIIARMPRKVRPGAYERLERMKLRRLKINFARRAFQS